MLDDRAAATPSSLARWLPLWGLAVLVGASFHMFEHVLQTYQAYVLGSDHAHGLLGQYLDTDWLHLAFNTMFLLALLPFWLRGGDLATWRYQSFLGGIAAAGYHVVEHSVKTWQSTVLGHDPALGIAGNYGPLIPIHLWINLVVFTLVLPHVLHWALRLRRALPQATAAGAAARAP